MSKYHSSLLFWIVSYLAVSFGLGYATQGDVQGWYQTLQKPGFNPPNWIFPIMWTFLYILIASAGWNLWRVRASTGLKSLFMAYTLLNWTWTPLFFGLQQVFLGFLWIVCINFVASIFIILSRKTATLSAYLMVLPLLWTLFAGVLNYFIWALNS